MKSKWLQALVVINRMMWRLWGPLGIVIMVLGALSGRPLFPGLLLGGIAAGAGALFGWVSKPAGFNRVAGILANTLFLCFVAYELLSGSPSESLPSIVGIVCVFGVLICLPLAVLIQPATRDEHST